jgi:hypothetical protein
MQDLPTSWGETLPIIVEIDDVTAETATITVSDLDGNIVRTKSGAFTSDEFDITTRSTDISLNANETKLALGNYNYQLRIDYTGGRVSKFPDKNTCCNDGETFKFPQIIILPANDEGPGVVS